MLGWHGRELGSSRRIVAAEMRVVPMNKPTSELSHIKKNVSGCIPVEFAGRPVEYPSHGLAADTFVSLGSHVKLEIY